MPNTCCDLHLHSYYSDGRASPGEIVRYAADIGLRVIAITDHDTVAGVAEAAHVAGQLGLEVIPAVELTSSWELPGGPPGNGKVTVDVLGYFIDIRQPQFLDFLQAEMDDLRRRIEVCCQALTRGGNPITLDDVLKVNHRYPGCHTLITALQKKGYARGWNDAFRLFTDAWSGVPPARISTGEAIAAIHQAGGAAVLAHPVSLGAGAAGEAWIGAQAVQALVDLGLDGLEVYHPRLDADARRHFQRLAGDFNLVVSGGSDEHGWPGGFPRMGSQVLSYATIKELQQRAASRRVASSTSS